MFLKSLKTLALDSFISVSFIYSVIIIYSAVCIDYFRLKKVNAPSANASTPVRSVGCTAGAY